MSDFSGKEFTDAECEERTESDFANYSDESWGLQADMLGFARILSEIVVGRSFEGNGHFEVIPSFVSKMIQRGQCRDLTIVESFASILAILKRNDFKIVEGVDIEEVSTFVNLIEFSEMLIE
jgi:hypothetical protein